VPRDSEKPQGKESKKNKPKKKKLLLILLVVLVVLAGSAAGWYFFFKSPSEGGVEVKKASVEEKQTVEKKSKVEVESEKLDLGEVVVNLTGNGGGHYLRVKVVIEYPKENKNLAKELKEKQHKVMDTLISTLRTKTLTDVTSAGSVENLKKSLLKEINNNLKTGDITGIYFTDFLVQ